MRVRRPKHIRRGKMARAEKILHKVSKAHNIDIKSMRTTDSRWPHFVQARRDFCIQADAAGIGARIIAKVLWCSPHTVRYHIKPKMREAKRRYYMIRRGEPADAHPL